MPDFRTLFLAGFVAAMPLASALADSPSIVIPPRPGLGPINTQSTLCDFRGCFGFGPQQWHRPAYVQPNYRPRNATGPTYYQPGATPRPALTYDPPTRKVQPPLQTNHVEWCRSEYRSYNPKTDRFLTYNGFYKTCHSPYN